MNRMLGLAALTALVLATSAASATEVTGKVEKIDMTAHTLIVDGKLFAASPENTVGVKLDQLKKGDKVKIFYEEPNPGPEPINAMTMTKMK